MSKMKLVHVTWLDSCSPNRKWQSREGLEEYGPARCQSVGWLIHQDKERLVLAASLGDDECEVGDVTAIPSNCVKRVRRLK